MVKVEIIKFGSSFSFHCCTHIAARLTDLDTGEEMEVEYGASPSNGRTPSLAEEQKNQDCCCLGTVTLYSNTRSLSEFRSAYNEKFGNNDDYDFCFFNCADAVDFTLNYFFEDAKPENCLYLSFRLLCFLGCIGCLGLAACPTPPPVTSPADVYRKACLMSCRFGTEERVPALINRNVNYS